MSSGRTCESSAWDSSSSTRRCSATSSWPRSHLNLVSRFMPGGIPISLGCLFIWLQKKASIPLCVNLCRNIEQPNSKIRYGRFSFFFIPYSVSSIHPVSALALPQVRFIEMLVHHIALLIVEILRVHPWQTVQDLLNRNEHHCPCGLLLPPVQYQLFLLQLLQERFRHLFHICRFLWRQRDVGLGEQIENHQFFFGQLLRKATLLFRIQLLREGHQLGEERLHVGRPGIVLVNHFLKFFEEINPGSVQLHHLRQFQGDLRSEEHTSEL